MRIRIDPFVIAMIVTIAVAALAAAVGLTGDKLPLAALTTAGIMLVFFLHGANLSPHALLAGLANWRVHLAVQATTFAFFPLIGGGLVALIGTGLAPESRTGILFLCALSSTVSTSVAMTAMARGNVPAAVFNATLSGIIGMFATPVLMSLMAGAAMRHLDPLPAILDIAKVLFAPFVAGQIARRWIGTWLAAHKTWINKVDRGTILLIVFSAFLEAFASGLWGRMGWQALAVDAVLVAVLLAVALGFTARLARILGLTRADEATLVFCGSKKSLANGAPIAAVLFGHVPQLGAILLPLMLYHQLQLIVCASLARRYAERAEGLAD